VAALPPTLAQQSQHSDTRRVINTAASTITAQRATGHRVMVKGLIPPRALAELMAAAIADEDVQAALAEVLATGSSLEFDGTRNWAELENARERHDNAVDWLASLLEAPAVRLEHQDADSLLASLITATEPLSGAAARRQVHA